MTKKNTDLAVEITKALLDKALSQNDLAKILGISTSSLYRKMVGAAEFTLSEVRKISKTLNMPPNIFFA